MTAHHTTRRVLLSVAVSAVALAGCAASRHASPSPSPMSADDVTQETQATHQAAAIATSVDADDWHAVHYESAVPIGAAVLLAMIALSTGALSWFDRRWSHQRELARIKSRNGQPCKRDET